MIEKKKLAGTRAVRFYSAPKQYQIEIAPHFCASYTVVSIYLPNIPTELSLRARIVQVELFILSARFVLALSFCLLILKWTTVYAIFSVSETKSENKREYFLITIVLFNVAKENVHARERERTRE